MNPAEANAWKTFQSGRKSAEEVASLLRRPVEPELAFRRLETLRRLAASTGAGASKDDGENLVFHLRWAALRRKLHP